jgi:poly-gamma-glutamate synthesis protein (capsule biosynthesis protein)
MAVGDILPHASWTKLCLPVPKLFKDVNSTLFEADVAIGNLETPLTKEKEVTESKDPKLIKRGRDFVFKCSDKGAAQAIRDAGFSVLTIANNHIMDYQEDGLTDTLDELKKAGIVTAGAGENFKDAEKPATYDAGGRKLIIFAASDVVPLDYEALADRAGVASMKDENALLEHVCQARMDNPDALIILSLHWGVEATYTPNNRQQSIAKMLIDCGADVIFGTHPHRIQGVEIYRDRPIFYSLGNFQFDAKKPGDESMIVKVVYEEGKNTPSKVSIIPVIIEKGGVPRVLKENEPEYAAITKRVGDLCRSLKTTLNGTQIEALPKQNKAPVGEPDYENMQDYK